MAKRLRPDHQTGHDLVTDAKENRRVIGVVAERHAGRQRDHVAGKKR